MTACEYPLTPRQRVLLVLLVLVLLYNVPTNKRLRVTFPPHGPDNLP